MDKECQLGGFSRKDSPYSKKTSPFSRKDSPYSKIVICPDWLLMESSFYLLLEDGEKIRI